jgi:hypothetical protein
MKLLVTLVAIAALAWLAYAAIRSVLGDRLAEVVGEVKGRFLFFFFMPVGRCRLRVGIAKNIAIEGIHLQYRAFAHRVIVPIGSQDARELAELLREAAARAREAKAGRKPVKGR